MEEEEEEEEEEVSVEVKNNEFTTSGFQLGMSPPLAPPPLSSSNQIPDDNVNSSGITSVTMDLSGIDVTPQKPSEQNGEVEKPNDSLPRPPPLVHLDTPPQLKPGYYDDEDDDVFLPSQPQPKIYNSNQERNAMKGSSTTQLLSLDTPTMDARDTPTTSNMIHTGRRGRGGRGRGRGGGRAPGVKDAALKSPVMVIGRRGRAAGRVLDETKLRLPLEKG